MQRFGWSLVFSDLGRVDGLVACVQGFAMAMKLRVAFGCGWSVVILFIRLFINHHLPHCGWLGGGHQAEHLWEILYN